MACVACQVSMRLFFTNSNTSAASFSYRGSFLALGERLRLPNGWPSHPLRVRGAHARGRARLRSARRLAYSSRHTLLQTGLAAVSVMTRTSCMVFRAGGLLREDIRVGVRKNEQKGFLTGVVGFYNFQDCAAKMS